MSTGLHEEGLLNEALKYGKVRNIVMLPGKSYCFIKCLDNNNAQQIYEGMHGKSKLAQNCNVLYLTYCLDGKFSFFVIKNFPFLTALKYIVPKSDNVWEQEMPPGLILLENFITDEEETNFLNSINWDVTENNIGKWI